ncbi:MAG: hypothetical protein ACI9LN_001713 [Saprospiraceae bacterium]|jgi:hypothetical protein
MKKDVTKILEAFQELDVDFENGYFEPIHGGKNEFESMANENGILALAYLLVDHLNGKSTESNIDKIVFEKFIIEIELVDGKQDITDLLENKIGDYVAAGCWILFLLFLIVSLFYGAFQLLSKLF